MSVGPARPGFTNAPTEDEQVGRSSRIRYSREDQIDEQFKSTIVSSGIAVFRTDILESLDEVADDFRYAVLPPVPYGFIRKRISVIAVPNLNALRWSCTDQEMMFDLGDTTQPGDLGITSYITEVNAGTYGVTFGCRGAKKGRRDAKQSIAWAILYTSSGTNNKLLTGL